MKRKFSYNSELIKDNMNEVLIQAPCSVYQEAKEWYPKANQFAKDFSKEFDKPIQVTSGLIACLSPQKEWFHNLDLTKEFLRSKGKTCRHTIQQKSKGKLIYDYSGSLHNAHLIIEGYLGGLKTSNFYRNILDPTDPNYVTIDTHMAQLMSGKMEYKDPTLKQYKFLKDILIEFAEEHKLIPSEMQSVLWLTWKNIKPKYINSKAFAVEEEYF